MGFETPGHWTGGWWPDPEPSDWPSPPRYWYYYNVIFTLDQPGDAQLLIWLPPPPPAAIATIVFCIPVPDII